MNKRTLGQCAKDIFDIAIQERRKKDVESIAKQAIDRFGTENISQLCQVLKIALCFDGVECNLFRNGKERKIVIKLQRTSEIKDNSKRYIIEKTGLKNF